MQSKFFTYILIIAVIFSFVSQLNAQENLDKYFKMLGSLEKAERDEAASILIKEGAEIIPAMKNLVTSKDSNLRQKQYALRILADVSNKDILPFVNEQYNALTENVLKIECLNIAGLYPAEKLSIAMFSTAVNSKDFEIALIAMQLVSDNQIADCFPNMLKNLENAEVSEQVKIASALSASSVFHNSKVSNELRTNFVNALNKIITDTKDNFEYKYQMTFALGYTGNDAAINQLLEIIKDQHFVNSVIKQIEKLEEEFKKTEEELKDKEAELKVAKEELSQKINDLRLGVAEKQIRFTDTAAKILGTYFGSKAFVEFSKLLKSEDSDEIEEAFFIYVINSTDAILQSIIRAFEEKAPTKIGEDEEAIKELEMQIEAFEKYISILKDAFVKFVVANPESYKTVLPLNNYFESYDLSDRLFDCFARISTPEIIQNMIDVYESKPAINDNIKIIILRKFRAIAMNDLYAVEVRNYNREKVLNMLITPALDALNDKNNDIISEGLQIIKANPTKYSEHYVDITNNIRSLLEKSDDTMISLACEVLVEVDKGNAAKTMLNILDTVTKDEARTKLLEAFAKTNFSSATEITKFLNKVENDLIDNAKNLELRKAVAGAISKTGDPRAITILTKSLNVINESELTDIEKYEFKYHVIEKIGEMRNTANSATTAILAEMNAALTKFSVLSGTTEVTELQLQNTLTTLIRKGLSALENIRSNDVIDKLQNFLNFEERGINIDTLKVLKKHAISNDNTKKVLDLIFNSFAMLKSTGGIESTPERIDFAVETLNTISGMISLISGRAKNDTRSFVRDLLILDNSEILKKAINLISTLKDKRARGSLRDLMKRHPELKAEIDAALEALN